MPMEMLRRLLCLSVIFTSSCSVFDQFEDTYSQRFSANDVVKINELQSKALRDVAAPVVQPIVAVYPSAFTDRALKHASNGKFFRVVERVGLDNLTKERQLIRSAREQMPDGKPNGVPPLLFAGVLLEGAVISYESNLATGGVGARYLGIGKSAQYRKDNITVSLRMVSVASGEILVEVMSQKTIFSYGQSEDVFRFIEMGTELVEIEAGNSRNESTTIALMKSIEGAVLELINIGYDRGFWTYEKTNNTDCDDDCVTPVGS
jgi:curli biogenesis system outer membrane secretion channel CsgG